MKPRAFTPWLVAADEALAASLSAPMATLEAAEDFLETAPVATDPPPNVDIAKLGRLDISPAPLTLIAPLVLGLRAPYMLGLRAPEMLGPAAKLGRLDISPGPLTLIAPLVLGLRAPDMLGLRAPDMLGPATASSSSFAELFLLKAGFKPSGYIMVFRRGLAEAEADRLMLILIFASESSSAIGGLTSVRFALQ